MREIANLVKSIRGSGAFCWTFGLTLGNERYRVFCTNLLLPITRIWCINFLLAESRMNVIPWGHDVSQLRIIGNSFSYCLLFPPPDVMHQSNTGRLASLKTLWWRSSCSVWAHASPVTEACKCKLLCKGKNELLTLFPLCRDEPMEGWRLELVWESVWVKRRAGWEIVRLTFRQSAFIEGQLCA